MTDHLTLDKIFLLSNVIILFMLLVYNIYRFLSKKIISYLKDKKNPWRKIENY